MLWPRLFAALVLVVTALLRCNPYLPSGGRSLLLVPAVVCLAVFEDTVPALLFALLAGAMWDVTSVGRDGVFTLFCAVAAAAVSLVVRLYFRRKTFSALLLCAVALAAAVAVSVAAADGSGADKVHLLFSVALPSAAVAELLSVGYYCLFKKIYRNSVFNKKLRSEFGASEAK